MRIKEIISGKKFHTALLLGAASLAALLLSGCGSAANHREEPPKDQNPGDPVCYPPMSFLNIDENFKHQDTLLAKYNNLGIISESASAKIEQAETKNTNTPSI